MIKNKMKRNQLGFTLLELLISITILAVLITFSNKSIQNAIRSKIKIQNKIDQMSSVRDALRIIERDINLAYHYKDLETEFKKNVQDSYSKSNNANQTTPQTNQPANPATTQVPGAQTNTLPLELKEWLTIPSDRKDPTTNFIGKEDSMYFPTLNTGRMNEDLIQADYVKVGYFVSDCKKPGAEDESGKCLMRITSPSIEGDITQGGSQVALVENISEFKLRYIGKGKQDWNTTWSTLADEASTKANFPEAIEVSLTVTKKERGSVKKVSMQIVAAVHFPNNK